jgi:CheY-like chemotaxis protein
VALCSKGRLMPRVLVVDDSEEMQDIYDIVLTAEGHVVERALDGEAGLRALQRVSPDVVLLDMMMPGMDGLVFLERMQHECASPRPPVIACSGFDAYREAALARGAGVFLGKPVISEVLLHAISGAMAGKQLDQHFQRNREATAELRHAGVAASAEIVARLEQRGLDPLRPWMRSLTIWLPRWYGFGIAVLHLLRGEHLVIEATHGDEPWLVEGMASSRSSNYCDYVLHAGSTLVISDALRHPARHFSDHPEVRASGFESYLGAPLTTSTGVVIGTLCIVDCEPHDFYSEDIHLVGRLAREVARVLEARAFDLPAEPPIDSTGVWTLAMLRPILEATLERCARKGGGVELAAFEIDRADAIESLVRHVYLVARGRGTALVQRAPTKFALVVGRCDPAAAKNALQAAIKAARSAVGPFVVASTSWSPVAPGRTIDSAPLIDGVLANVGAQ